MYEIELSYIMVSLLASKYPHCLRKLLIYYFYNENGQGIDETIMYQEIYNSPLFQLDMGWATVICSHRF